jgi:hypothetical protein
MIRQLHSYAFDLVGITGALILSACTGTVTSPSTSPVAPSVSTLTTLPSPTLTLQPTSTPTAVPASLTPTSTRRPTVTPPLNTATPSQTPVPTLEARQQAQVVADLLKTNGDCNLPCWWGIVPGSTQFRTIIDSFKQQGINLYLVGNLAGVLQVDVPHPTQLFDYGFSMELIAEQGVISRLEVDGETYNLTQSRRFANDWQRYSLSNILQEYGQPSAIRFISGPPAERDAPVLYALTLLYEPSGFAISYTGPAQFDNQSNVIHACPGIEQMNDIRLVLVSPGEPVSKSSSELADLGPTLQETIGMSIEEFYGKFKRSNSRDCLGYQLIMP